MYKYFWLGGLLLVGSHLTFAQVNMPLLSDLGVENRFFMMVPVFDPAGQVKGSPYYQDAWSEGRVLLQNGKLVANRALRFRVDALNNMLLVKDPSERVISLANEGLAEVWLVPPKGGDTLHLKKYAWDEKAHPQRLLRVLYASPTLALVQDIRKVYYQPTSQESSAYAPDAKIPRFDEKYTYWIRQGAGPFERANLKRNSLVEALPAAQRAAATAFCKEKGYKGTLEEAEAVALLRQFATAQ